MLLASTEAGDLEDGFSIEPLRTEVGAATVVDALALPTTHLPAFSSAAEHSFFAGAFVDFLPAIAEPEVTKTIASNVAANTFTEPPDRLRISPTDLRT